MSKFINRSFFVTVLLLSFFVTRALADIEFCSPDDPSSIVSVKASANAFSNLTSRSGSLKYELNAMLSARLAEAKKMKSVDSSPSTVFSTIPNKFQGKYSDKSECEVLLKQTEKEPIRYLGKRFETKDALVSWFYDFTQGNGDEGEDLYSKCPGSCSPQYTSVIKQDSGVLLLDIIVLCGHARDKSDNQYNLSSYLSSSC